MKASGRVGTAVIMDTVVRKPGRSNRVAWTRHASGSRSDERRQGGLGPGDDRGRADASRGCATRTSESSGPPLRGGMTRSRCDSLEIWRTSDIDETEGFTPIRSAAYPVHPSKDSQPLSPPGPGHLDQRPDWR